MTVFANGLEISAKAQGCKVIAAFPDTCMTPPQAPPTPPGVPIPYPDFGFDKDTTKGTGTVKIGGKEVSQENASKYSKCSGDEAGAAPKKGLVTSNNTGPMYAQKWSMNVKFEGKGVVRFSDMATGNHACVPPDSPTMVIVGKPNIPGDARALTCIVGEYGKVKDDCNNQGGQAHHVIPDEYLRDTSREVANAGAEAKAAGGKDTSRSDPSFPSVSEGCCICVGGNAAGKHSDIRTSTAGKATRKKGRQNYVKVQEKLKAHPDVPFCGFQNGRGHGFAHFVFDGLFGKKPRPIGEAVKLAKFTLAELAKYDGTVIDTECAKLAIECIEKQMGPAMKKKPQPTCGRTHRNSPALDERVDPDGTKITAMQTQFDASLISTGL